MFFQRKKSFNVISLAVEDEERESPPNPAVAVQERMDSDEFIVGDTGFYGGMHGFSRGCIEPIQEFFHEELHFDCRWRAEGYLAGFSVFDDYLSFSVLTGVLRGQYLKGGEA